MDAKWIPVILTERWKLSSPVSQPSPQISQLTLPKKTRLRKQIKTPPSPPPFSSPPVRLIRQNLSEVCNQLAESRGGLEPCRL